LAISGKFSVCSVQVTDYIYIYMYATTSVYLITHLRMGKVKKFLNISNISQVHSQRNCRQIKFGECLLPFSFLNFFFFLSGI